jgi:hypothetical protein
MKTIFKSFAVAFTGLLLLTSCKKEATEEISDDAASMRFHRRSWAKLKNLVSEQDLF